MRKPKPKLNYGALIEANHQKDAAVDNTGVGIASAFGPVWGGLAKLGVGASKKIRGSGTSRTNNFMANAADPFSWAKDNDKPGEILMNLVPGLQQLSWWKKAKRQKQEAIEEQNLINADASRQTFSGEAGLPTFKHGGKMMTKPNVIRGGNLSAISPDAVEVNANNPSETDSVELNSAFVDNNEVIDRKNRVFSDDLVTPSGITIAKQAKKFEKMKSPNPRFADSNARVEQKLDDLFEYQEELNGMDPQKAKSYERLMKAGLVKGGVLRKGKPKYNTGGPFDMSALTEGMTKIDVTNDPQYKNVFDFQFGNKQQDPMSFNTWGDDPVAAKKKFDWKGLGTNVATYAPDLINMALTASLPKPPKPRFELTKKLSRVNPDAALAENARITTNLGKSLTKTTSQAGIAASNLGALLAKRLSGDNAVRSEYNRLNAQIQGQEASLNTGIGARNTERMNDYLRSKLERKNRQLAGYSQIASNVGNKVLMQTRESNLKDLSLAELEVLKKAYQDSGVYDRNFQAVMDALMAKNGLAKRANRRGGRLWS
jgi:hypothetical protein